MHFYRSEPTPRSAWRMAILMGANTRTYKFALGHALLSIAEQGRDEVTLDELAIPYAMSMAEHVTQAPQAPGASSLGESDYLSILRTEAPESLRHGSPTERLMQASVKSMPGMVMRKFHNLRGATGIPIDFYSIDGSRSKSTVTLSSELLAMAQSPDRGLLSEELQTRWGLVESAFDSNIGTSLVREGVLLTTDADWMLDTVRRAPVAQARTALVGFQHGRCFYCREPLSALDGSVHVDHVYPYSLMTTGGWIGPDLNAVWNLVVAHSECNLEKSNRLPTEGEVTRLMRRNEAILGSPHPLRRTLQLLVGSTPSTRQSFYVSVDSLANFH